MPEKTRSYGTPRKDGKDALYATDIAPEIDADISNEYWTHIRKPARNQPGMPAIQTPYPKFRQKTFSMGREQLFPWDKALATADVIEDESLGKAPKKAIGRRSTSDP